MADYIFLSPPWGGINYKRTDIYSIKDSMTPDISEIIEVCLRISKYIMFYVPRTLMIEELFEIISQINEKKRLFFDIHILKSANKIKALLIIFGYDIDKKIEEKDIDGYLKYIYGLKLSEIYIKLFSSIAKIIGNYRFFENEINFRKSLDESEESLDKNYNIGKELFNYFFKLVLTEQEKIKIKSLKVYSQFKSINNNKNKSKKNIIINNKDKDKENDNLNKNTSINNENIIYNFIEENTVTYTGDNNDNYIKLKENNNINYEKLNFPINNNLKYSPKSTKIFNLGEFYEHDEKNILSNSPSHTVSTSPSSSIICTSNKKGKDRKIQKELVLTSCHEINLNYIKI